MKPQPMLLPPMQSWLSVEGALEAREHFVYRVYDKNDYLLYIGRTKNTRARWYQHQRECAEWVPYAHHCRMTGPLDYGSAHALEQEQIFKMQPAYNKRGLRGGSDIRSISSWLVSA